MVSSNHEPRIHRYAVRCCWSGSTGGGYETYGRRHEARLSPGAATLVLSADPAFRGDPALPNPEQLVVAAAASCQLLSFLALAARARVDVRDYDDEAEGVMPEDDPPTRLTAVVLRPTIRVAPGTSAERVNHLVEVAHRECYVANSLRTEIRVEPTVVVDPS
ncbi:MAG: OsmC family protein [Acidimicrobiales bacterium]|jgi:organic hydroperoxide reductase OsmC/OhrA